jgi:hypothetical protein
MKLAGLARRPWLLALLVGLVAAGVSGAVMAHNGDATAIHACVNQGSTPRGQVIIYSAPGMLGSDPNSVCGTRGLAVDWNGQGVQGPTGLTGATGATGVGGPSGATGTTGATGASGLAGPSGPTGPSGLDGASGPTGTAGAAGATGPTGATGPQGTGNTGKTAFVYPSPFLSVAGGKTPTGHPATITTNSPNHKIQMSGHVVVVNLSASPCLFTSFFSVDGTEVPQPDNGPALLLGPNASSTYVGTLSFSNVLSLPTAGPHSLDLLVKGVVPPDPPGTVGCGNLTYSLISVIDLG